MRPLVALGIAAIIGLGLAGIVEWRVYSTHHPSETQAESRAGSEVFASAGLPSRQSSHYYSPPPAALPPRQPLAAAGTDGGAPARTGRQEPLVVWWGIDSMGALQRPQTDADRALEQAAAREYAPLLDVTHQPNPDTAAGAMVPGSFRQLGSDIGSLHTSAYAFRTDQGRVCGGMTGLSTGCFEGFTTEQGVSYSITNTHGFTGTIVYGFAPDRLTAVNVVYDDGNQLAPVTNNVFYAEIANHTMYSLRALELLVEDDGGVERIPLHITPHSVQH